MKTICETNSKTFLVEMSENEYRALSALQQAVDGAGEYSTDFFGEIVPLAHNMETAFKAVALWVSTCYSVNQLRQGVEELESALQSQCARHESQDGN